jgi:hypothetical protein
MAETSKTNGRWTNEWWEKDVPGRKNIMAGGQKLEDQIVLQELQITEQGWHTEDRQERVLKKGLEKGEPDGKQTWSSRVSQTL